MVAERVITSDSEVSVAAGSPSAEQPLKAKAEAADIAINMRDCVFMSDTLVANDNHCQQEPRPRFLSQGSR